MPQDPRCVMCRTRLTTNPRGPAGGIRRGGLLYCSLECYRERREGKTTRGVALKAARRHRGEQCDACGALEGLVVHHCDGDWRNNAPSNLQTLCVVCHNAWHTDANRAGRGAAGRMPHV